jgi:hypothetical protein
MIDFAQISGRKGINSNLENDDLPSCDVSNPKCVNWKFIIASILSFKLSGVSVVTR